MKLTFNLSIDTTTGKFEIVNTSTGEVKTVSVPKKSSKKIKDESTNPQLILMDNKYGLNSAAIKLLNVQPDDRLDIKYEGSSLVPVIGKDEAFGTKCGNKLTKGYTVSYRGNANKVLSKYGSVFDIVPHPSLEGLFILKGDKEPDPISGDENVSLPETVEDLGINLEDLVADSNETEISSFDFTI